MRYVFYVLALVVVGLFWVNNSQQGRKILHNMDAVGERNAAKYR